MVKDMESMYSGVVPLVSHPLITPPGSNKDSTLVTFPM